MFRTGLEDLVEKVANALPVVPNLKKPLWQKALPYGLAAGAGFAYYQGRANQEDAKYKNLVSAPMEGSY